MDVIKEGYMNNLKDRLFGLLCEREKDRDWIGCLDSIQLEIMGFDDSVKQTINFLRLSYLINSLRFLKYEYFRKTIFDAMALIGKMSGE